MPGGIGTAPAVARPLSQPRIGAAMRGRPSAAALENAGDFDTRTRILDAAERLIAERGFHGVSLREITAEARANSAAIHYYFRRKEDLLAAVVDRRAGIVVQERLDRLNALIARPKPPTLEELILAYVTPGLTACFGSDELRKHFGRLRARFTHETDPAMRAIMRRHFREPGRVFIEAITRLLPSLTKRELQWRFHVMVATLIYLMAHPGRVQAVDAEAADCYNPDDMHEALHYVAPMLAAVFRAPPAADHAGVRDGARTLSDKSDNGDR
jgi:AcrR family transcriptional regulator